MLPGTQFDLVAALSCVLVSYVWKRRRKDDDARGVGIHGGRTRRIEDKIGARELIKVNDSVYELSNPKSNRTSVELVFFHGLQLEEQSDEKAYKGTWRDKKDGECWLEWLLEKEYFPDARILVISYDAWVHKTHDRGRFDPYLLGECLVRSLMLANVGQGGYPVVLVGHCVGCLVVKQICWEAHATLALTQNEWELEEFLHNIKGFFFFAPPNQGSQFADDVADDAKTGKRSTGPMVGEMGTKSVSRARLNGNFRKLRRHYNWKVYAVAETHGMHLRNFGGQVVVEASSRSDVDYYIPVGENHTNVCRPVDSSSTSFQSIVRCVRTILSEATNVEAGKASPELTDTVGLTKTVTRLAESLRDKSSTSHVQFLGLTGMGGVGKTTLAQAIFQIIRRDFHFTCFLENVKNQVETNSRFLTLQSKILDKMQLKGRSVFRKISWADLRREKVLIVLDDVGSRTQILRLPECVDFARGSCVVVTSRNRSILDEDVFDVEEVKFLNFDDSLRLFCRHAFHEERVPSELKKYEQLSKSITRKCGGLPLSLEVIGNHLHQARHERQRLRIWEEALTKLHKAERLEWDNSDRLWAVLRICYDGLGEPEKSMFLDIACCFFGEDEGEVLAMWRGLYQESAVSGWSKVYNGNHAFDLDQGTSYSGWKTLRDRNLAKSTVPHAGDFGSPVITMHEQLRDFGRRESLKYGRWLCDTKIAVDLLKCTSSNEQDRDNVEIIKLDSWLEEQGFDMSRLVEFRKLKVLWLKDVFLENVCGKIERRLVSLKLAGSFEHFAGDSTVGQPDLEHALLSLGEIPSLVHFNLKLAVDSSEHTSHLQFAYDESRRRRIHQDSTVKTASSKLGRPSKLQHLVIDGVTPWERFGQLKSLKYLTINNCRSQKLGSFISSFQDMTTLEVLKIHRCNWLLELPESLGFLASLQHLEVSNCLSLEHLPSFLHLSNLEILKLWNLPQLSSLPENMGRLKRLRSLELVNCTKVGVLPSSITELSGLESLVLESCSMLRVLPPEFDRMSRLREIKLKGLPNIEELPVSLGNLECMKRLIIVDCEKMRISPSSFLHLNKLEDLKLGCLSLMEEVPISSEGFPELRRLVIRNCNMLEEVSSGIKATKLNVLKLVCLPLLRSVPASIEREKVRCGVFIVNLHPNHPHKYLGFEDQPREEDDYFLSSMRRGSSPRPHCYLQDVLPTSYVGYLRPGRRMITFLFLLVRP